MAEDPRTARYAFSMNKLELSMSHPLSSRFKVRPLSNRTFGSRTRGSAFPRGDAATSRNLYLAFTILPISRQCHESGGGEGLGIALYLLNPPFLFPPTTIFWVQDR